MKAVYSSPVTRRSATRRRNTKKRDSAGVEDAGDGAKWASAYVRAIT